MDHVYIMDSGLMYAYPGRGTQSARGQLLAIRRGPVAHVTRRDGDCDADCVATAATTI